MRTDQVRKSEGFLVLIAALGYFVDIYDLLLFSIVRVPSLKDMGFSDQLLLAQGVRLLNYQMIGMLLGGVAFGILADKYGRISVLFGSILIYSLANLANAFVRDADQYILLRFIAGFGLAGELGVGITLVTETLSRHRRGIGTMIVGTVGVSGALLAWAVASLFNWRTAFLLGGVMGLLLLFLRMKVLESGLYQGVCAKPVKRGDIFIVFHSAERLKRFLGGVLIGIPVWFVVGILITLSPEFAQVLGVKGSIDGGRAVLYCYIGLIFGDLVSGLLSQLLKSRRKSIAFFLLLASVGIFKYFKMLGPTADQLYGGCIFLGFACGYWAMFVTVAAEQFGTNLRATIATSTPNFVRGSLVPVSAAFMALKPRLGMLTAGAVVGIGVMLLAFLGLGLIQESFGANLEFEEE